MTRYVKVLNQTQGTTLVTRAKWCESFLCRLRGLTFRRKLESATGLILVQRRESLADATIHMLGVFFPLGIIWIDAQRRVVDHTIAHPMRIYAPQAPAQYVLEGDATIVERVAVGDVLEFQDR